VPASAHDLLQTVLETDRARILSSLIRTCGGDFDLAEEALHDAVVAATTQWPQRGNPEAPDAWLLQTARHKAIDAIRRDQRKREKLEELGYTATLHQEEKELTPIPDDMLRLIFTCCHPALSEEARLALTLRTVVGLPTIEIARAFLVSEQTMAQRLVRAKKKIRDAGIPYRVPERSEMPERLEAVLLAIYLVFNEGYSASSGEHVVRGELCAHAIHIGRILSDLMPEEGETTGLLALMLLQDSRRRARMNEDGDLVLLRDQDRSLWNREQIDEGLRLCRVARATQSAAVYGIQAAIAAEHARSTSADDTDWRQIVRLYGELLRARPTPVVALNHAVATAMAFGAEEALRLVNTLADDLDSYGPFHAARADFYRTAGRWGEAEDAYRRAIALATNDPERRFLQGRLREVRSEKLVCDLET
jgi:RNA polymerase sigma-70 factor (ECF subfamily)